MVRFCSFLLAAACLILTPPSTANAKDWQQNTDESKVPDYVLPDPLVMLNGRPVADEEAWRTQRRPEILELFKKFVYGKTPESREGISFEVRSVAKEALEGKATRKEIRIRLNKDPKGPKIDVLLYLPNGAKKPVPVFLGLNFYGNQTIHSDPGIALADCWLRNEPKYGAVNHRTTAASRGTASSRWPVQTILARGYGLVTACYCDIYPDYENGFQSGVQPLFYQKDQTRPASDEWGAIGAWAWGLSRIVDYLETDPDIDAKHVAVMGHSRLGKTALWAGAQDERFALVISNDSGRFGASITRRRFGEPVEFMLDVIPYWFCGNLKVFANSVDVLPVDQHMLIALTAPRPVYVASAVEDTWADPRGEFLACKYASPVWGLFGLQGIPAQEMPAVDQPVLSGDVGYHVRKGDHDVTDFDWKCFMDFADRHFAR